MDALTAQFGPWATTFKEVYDRAVSTYEAGTRRVDGVFSKKDTAFIASIGCSPQELYDFVEDWCEVGEPPFEMVLQITAIRREYFLKEQGGRPSADVVPFDAFPAMDEALGGYRWLPRIIAKARAKLRGELPSELMYSCGGDRQFLKSVSITAPDFLRIVWSSGNDDQKILDYVRRKSPEDAQRDAPG